MAENKQSAAEAEAEARDGSSSEEEEEVSSKENEVESEGQDEDQVEGEEESESESASESESEEKEVENEEQEQDEDQVEGEEESESASESESEEKEVENEEQEQDEDQDEGEEGSASESESECEEKEEENTIPAALPKKPSSGSAAAAAQHPQSSSSSSSRESDSSPINHCGVDPNMKMMQPNAAAAAASAKIKKPISNPTLKRPVVESENRESKRAKAVKVNVNANAHGVEDTLNKSTTCASKKVFFQRLWSADDEIAILQGIIDYTATKGVDPSADMNAFFLFIKDFIHVHVTKTQLSDKVRKLKNKYKTNAIKAKLPSNPHDQQLYDLSQKIWNFQTNAAKLDTTNNNKDVVHGKPILKDDALNRLAEIERELKKLQIRQVELYLRRVELISEQTKLVLDSQK